MGLKQEQVNLRIESPIPKAMSSKNDRDGIWEKIGVIPYRGKSKNASHRYLKLLFELFEHSPSFGAIVNDITTFGFDGEIDLAIGGKVGIKSNESVLSDNDKGDYCDFLERIGLSPLQVIEVSKEIVKYLKICGNAYLAYRRFEVNGEYKVSIKLLHPMHVMYRRLKDGSKGDLVFSLNFTNENIFKWSMKESEFKEYKVYPNVRETTRSLDTVFHIKNNGEVYGEPEGLQSLYWQYVEYALGSLSSKVTSSEFVATHLLEIPALSIDQVSGDNDNVKYLQGVKNGLVQALTTKGVSPNTIGVIQNPNEKDFTLHELDVNRDTDWFKCQEETARRKIYEQYRHFPQLTGAVEMKSSLGGDSLTPLYLAFESKTIKPVQRRIANEWQTIMSFIARDTRNEDQVNVKFVFPNNIGDYIANLKESRSENEALTD